METARIHEIHRYRGDKFQYVVARTNKHGEDYVKADVDRMNTLLSQEMKAEGIRYVFALGTVDGLSKKAGEKAKKTGRGGADSNSSSSKVELAPS